MEWKQAFGKAKNNDSMHPFEYNVQMMVLNETSYFIDDPSMFACQNVWKDKIYKY